MKENELVLNVQLKSEEKEKESKKRKNKNSEQKMVKNLTDINPTISIIF